MLAYKFLRTSAVGPFTGFAWPCPGGEAPGPWVHAVGAPALCRNGIHACHPDDLPYWICDELWVLELAGPRTEEPYHVVAPSGRLIERVAAWDRAAAAAFTQACTWRIRDRAVVALTRAGNAVRAAELGACARIDELRDVTAAIVAAPIGDTVMRPASTAPNDDRTANAADVVGYLADVIAYGAAGRTNLVAFTAARVADRASGDSAAERALQAQWFRNHILHTYVGAT